MNDEALGFELLLSLLLVGDVQSAGFDPTLVVLYLVDELRHVKLPPRRIFPVRWLGPSFFGPSEEWPGRESYSRSAELIEQGRGCRFGVHSQLLLQALAALLEDAAGQVIVP
ncbi:MAG: hypothetical protein AMXMBFR33_47470 [Candidatus Xenobia bacterium]